MDDLKIDSNALKTLIKHNLAMKATVGKKEKSQKHWTEKTPEKCDQKNISTAYQLEITKQLTVMIETCRQNS
jgi:hypothetical protein